MSDVSRRQQKDTALAAHNSGVVFLEAALRGVEPIELGGGNVSMPIAAGLVNAAFAVELLFKAILLDEGVSQRGHELKALFQQLSPGAQQAIIADAALFMGSPESKVRAELTKTSRLFNELRYHWEKLPAFKVHVPALFALAFSAIRRFRKAEGRGGGQAGFFWTYERLLNLSSIPPVLRKDILSER